MGKRVLSDAQRRREDVRIQSAKPFFEREISRLAKSMSGHGAWTQEKGLHLGSRLRRLSINSARWRS
jgi:hypothetical protein